MCAQTPLASAITSSMLCFVRQNSAGGCFESSGALIGGRSSRGAAGAVFSDTPIDRFALLPESPTCGVCGVGGRRLSGNVLSRVTAKKINDLFVQKPKLSNQLLQQFRHIAITQAN